RVLGSMPTGKNGVVAATSTNNRGDYEFIGLLPGQYYIVDAVGNYYSGKSSNNPTPVHLRPGETMTNDDIKIPASIRTVSGQIVDASHVPVKSAEIAIVRREAVAAAALPNFRRTTGSFTMTTAARGAYVVLARSIQNGALTFGYAPVEIGAAD